MGFLRTLFGGRDDDDDGREYDGVSYNPDDEVDSDYLDEEDDEEEEEEEDDVGEVVIICDNGCGNFFQSDVIGETDGHRFAATCEYLTSLGWETGRVNICPGCRES
jgi:hypothetical protein